ncbi:hypothetical protein WR25_12168 [Diploscapter pachys]|uniref:Uncharacterized protein n=1 Tax=Diploscapter pachys TaxID=2018661 RepID=A0A2A2KVZ1_9BILA|nr:hypothetical protein WR25_12168 [Diploscapter pachys]
MSLSTEAARASLVLGRGRGVGPSCEKNVDLLLLPSRSVRGFGQQGNRVTRECEAEKHRVSLQNRETEEQKEKMQEKAEQTNNKLNKHKKKVSRGQKAAHNVWMSQIYPKDKIQWQQKQKQKQKEKRKRRKAGGECLWLETDTGDCRTAECSVTQKCATRDEKCKEER